MEETKPKSSAETRTAHIISDVFCPLLIPTYAMIVAMCLTRMSYLPGGIRFWTTLGIFGITCMLPLVFILILLRAGKVSDMSISNPRQRRAPYWVSIICYFAAAAYLAALHAPIWLSTFFIGAGLVSVLCMIITNWWKISAHTASIAGFAAIVFWLSHTGLLIYSPLVWSSVAFMLIGIMAWARLYLNHHTLMQTAAGAALAFTVEYVLLCIMTF